MLYIQLVVQLVTNTQFTVLPNIYNTVTLYPPLLIVGRTTVKPTPEAECLAVLDVNECAYIDLSWQGCHPSRRCLVGGSACAEVIESGRGTQGEREVTEASSKRKRKAFLNDANQSGGAWPSLPHQPAAIHMS